ncbi:thiol reductant ABC exporter subunit CydC [Corynebacterium vitaeruminis]|uniref:thiol reductant ABC exporter subunit CydC n=1 Tax=Corynebacterium vitaeruminis TaxID=38305 RepID=UPI0023F0B6D0|nr:thiol reductant ABC exporter subunit CydC [Corynebacterium vitaeruminis]
MSAFQSLISLLSSAGVRRRQVLAAVALSTATLCSALGLTVLSGWLITRAWQMPPVLDLSVAITAVRALGISRGALRYVDRLYAHRIALRAESRLRCVLFDASRPGTSVSVRDADVQRMTDALVRSLVPFGTAAVMSAIAVAWAALLQPWAAIILLAAFVVSGVLAPMLAARSARAVEQVRDLNVVEEALGRLTRDRAEYTLAGRLGALEGEASRASRKAADSTQRALSLTAASRALGTLAQGLAIAGVAWVGLNTYADDPMWLGMLVLIPLASFEAHGGLDQAAVHLDEASRTAVRVSGALHEEPALGPAPRVLDVSAENLLCAYGERRWTLDAPFGSRIILRGPSGMGKSTLLRTLAGELPARDGRVRPSALARYHSEDEWVFATTVRENLLLAKPDATDAELEAVLDAVGLGLPLDLLLEDGAGSLSSGQRRRLLLARALISDAPILLLDEPTEHIAEEDARELLAMLQAPRLPGTLEDRTIIAVTHLEDCDVSRETSTSL